ncbi:MAG: OmpH family outer membrane protein [Candidatus Riflebacteria bacterium]|nr:OmpH family outer membrane protein [Candidatus Riflebacteria bacterium]
MLCSRSLTLALVAALGLSTLPLVSWAAVRFATVDMARVLREYDEVKRVAAKLQAQKDEYQEAIDKQQQEIRQINEELQSTKDVDKKSKLEKSKKQKLVSLQSQFQKLKEKLGEMEKEQFDLIKIQIYNEIEKLAQAKNLEMVTEKQWLYHPRQAEDITEELLKALESAPKSTPRKKSPPPQPKDPEE